MKYTSILLLTFLTFVSCEENEVANVGSLTGTYKGSFSRSNPTIKFKPSDVTLKFDGDKFQGTSSIPEYPAICNGTYNITGQEIEFNNLCAWTAEFDWSYILSGKFAISINGDDLTMTRSYDGFVQDIYSVRRQ